MKRRIIIYVTLLVAMFGAAFNASAWESYMNVYIQADVADGVLGYVSTTKDQTPVESKFRKIGTEDVAFALTWSGDALHAYEAYLSKNIYVYIKAKPEKCKITNIERWNRNAKWEPEKKEDCPVTQCIETTVIPTTDKRKEGTTVGLYHKFKAITIPAGVVAVNYDDWNISDNEIKPTVSYSPEYNYEGEQVTLKATMPQYTDGNGNTYDNPHYKFDGWYDGDTRVSNQPEGQITAGKGPLTLTARYSFTPGFVGKGYYRIRTARNDGSREYIKVVGNVGGNNSIGDQRFTTANLVLTGDAVSEYPYSEGDPSTIFYFDGTMNTAVASDAKNLSFGKQFSPDAVLTSQGASTATMYDAFGGKIEIASGHYAGSIALRPAGSDKWITRVSGADKAFGGLAINGNQGDLDASFELEPVNEGEHYFGVTPDEKTLYNGGYWTTMYTSFPYTCSTDVVPYYLKVTDKKCNYELFEINTIGSDNRKLVPANTPVVLKCLTTSAAPYKLIPVAPDEETVEPITDNYLAGVFQLNETLRSGSNDLETAKLYDFRKNSSNQDYVQTDPLKYVFRCITEADLQNGGKVRAREGAEENNTCPIAFDQSQSGDVLNPNSVYLNAQKIVEDFNIAPEDLPEAFSITDEQGTKPIPTGVEGVNVGNAAPEYYNLQGMRVNRPTAGEIYIVRVGDRTFKAVYRGA